MAASKLNAEWHARNKMPRNPSLDQRIAWHVEHAKACSCRPLTEKLRKEIDARGIELPEELLEKDRPE